MALRALLIDLDNTAYAYAPCHAAGLAAAQRLAGERLPAWSDPETFTAAYSEARRLVKARLLAQAASHSRLLYFKQMLETAAGRTDPALALALDTAYWDQYDAAMKLDPGCAEALQAWRAAGLRLAWVTDMTTPQQLRKLLALGLAQAAEVMVTSEEAGADKPHPSVLDLALFHLRVPVSQAWLIGDSRARDVGAARARGMTSVWFRRGQSDEAGPQPHHTVDDWPALQALVEQALSE